MTPRDRAEQVRNLLNDNGALSVPEFELLKQLEIVVEDEKAAAAARAVEALHSDADADSDEAKLVAPAPLQPGTRVSTSPTEQ